MGAGHSDKLELQSKRQERSSNWLVQEKYQGKTLKKQLIEDSQNEKYLHQRSTPHILYRVSKEQMHSNLYRHIGPLLFKQKGLSSSSLHGTGLLISPNLVLTCSCNIVDLKTKEEHYDLRFYPGHCGLLDFEKGNKIQKVFYPAQFNQLSNSIIGCRYALLKLSSQIQSDSFIPLKVISESDSIKRIAIFGYPGNREYQDQFDLGSQIFQWGLRKTVESIKIDHLRGTVRHSITTYNGHRGSPIIVQDGDELSVIGIHKGDSQNWKNDEGILITQSIIDEMKNKASEWGAEMFKTYVPGIRVNPLKLNSTKLEWVRILREFQKRMQYRVAYKIQNSPMKLYKVPDSEMNQLPHQLIGMISFGKNGRGSGVLLSPNLVLTAAYNIYNRQSKEKWVSLTFSPGFSSIAQQNHYQIEASYVNDKFFTVKSLQFDYGLLKLSKKIHTKEFIPIKIDPNIDQLNHQLAVFGYSHVNCTDEQIYQMGNFGKNCVLEISNKRKELLYILQTQPAMGGGPIFSLDSNAGLTIVGIHQGVINKEEKIWTNIWPRCGRLMTSQLVEELRRQAERMGADPFLIANN